MAEAPGGVGFALQDLGERLGLRLLVDQRPRPHLPRHLARSDDPLARLDLRRLNGSVIVVLTLVSPTLLLFRFEFARG